MEVRATRRTQYGVPLGGGMIKAAVEEDRVRPFGFAELGGHCVCGWRAVTRESGGETLSFVLNQGQA